MADPAQLVRLSDRHAGRVATHDPLPALAPLEVSEGSQLLWAGDGEAVAVLDLDETDPTTTLSLWVPAVVARVRLRAATEPAALAAGALLRRAAAAAPADVEVHLSTPSRDLALVRPLLEGGFAPSTVLAVRRLPAPEQVDPVVTPAGVTLRRTAPQDAEAMVAARLALHRYETTAGLTPRHPDAEELLRQDVGDDLADDLGLGWVAERDGRVVGLCDVNPPARAGWIAGALAAGPVGYLKTLHVDDTERGTGVGAALAAAGHAGLTEQGARWVLLHHGATNPLSAPFWARAGYRPLLTSWVKQPRRSAG